MRISNKRLLLSICLSLLMNVPVINASANSPCDPPYVGNVYDSSRSPLRNYSISSTAGIDANGFPTVQLGYADRGVAVPRLGVLSISVEYKCFGVSPAHNPNGIDYQGLLGDHDLYLEIVSQNITNLGNGWYRQDLKLQPRLTNSKGFGGQSVSAYFSRCEVNPNAKISTYTFAPYYPWRRDVRGGGVFNASELTPDYPINKPYSIGFDCATFLKSLGENCVRDSNSPDCQGYKDWSIVQSGSMLLSRESSTLKIELPKKSPKYGLEISGFEILVTYQKTPGYTFRGDMWADSELFSSYSGFTGSLDLLKIASWANSKGFNLSEARLFGITPRFKGQGFTGQTNAIYTLESLLLNEIVKKVEQENAAAAAKTSAELKAKQEAEAKAIADKAFAELKAKQEADLKAAVELKAKLDAELKAAAELKAKQEADAKAAAIKKTTITCVKGKLTKKVTATKPKCPTGFKIKK
jgi:hypothetical protein